MSAQEVRLVDNNNNAVIFQPRLAKAVSPSDTTVFQPGTLYVGSTGTVKVRTIGGDTITFTNVADSFILPVQVDMVYLTGTDAGNMVIMR